MSAIIASAAFDPIAAELERRARVAGEAAAEAMRVQRSEPEKVWRDARLLWPLFTKG